jgi:hypothetical protein
MIFINISNFIEPFQTKDYTTAIYQAVDNDMKHCIIDEKVELKVTTNRVLICNNPALQQQSCSFSLSLFEKIKSIFIKIGAINDLFSDLRSSYGDYGLDLVIDKPSAGEGKLRRVADYYDNDSNQYKKHTLIFNHTLEVINDDYSITNNNNKNIFNRQYHLNTTTLSSMKTKTVFYLQCMLF